eukprot:c21781_g1_i1 orf=180-794(+)
MATSPVRLLNFISEHELEEVREKKGPRVEDGAVSIDKPLYEILKENKEKQQSEFNERFKHRPPKALDEEETEFLDKLEMYQKQQERQLADEEARQLLNFKLAVANRTVRLEETNSSQTQEQEKPMKEKRRAQARPLASLIRVKPQAKKFKIEEKTTLTMGDTHDDTIEHSYEHRDKNMIMRPDNTGIAAGVAGLVSYDDESDDD